MFAPTSDDDCYVKLTPSDMVQRSVARWNGLRAEVITATQRTPFTFRFKSSHHLLIAAERLERDNGETNVEGLPTSTLRSGSGKLTFVPARHAFSGWQEPRVLTRVTIFYIDPKGPLLDTELNFGGIEFQPRLFFTDQALWCIAGKLKNEVLKSEGRLQHYGEALSVLLGHELVRLHNVDMSAQAPARGGLSGWQQKKVADFIEANVAESVPLATLAALVDFSPFHFARAFKRSFGLPPHRYHVSRRIERAKELLAVPNSSVTEVALAVGFAETSSFSAAFRKYTGRPPSDFRREWNEAAIVAAAQQAPPLTESLRIPSAR